MPIYEYRCADCGFQKEFIQKMSDAPYTQCPSCNKQNFNKLVSAAGFQLKGTGWYQTDFKNTAKPKEKAVDKPADKVESKPEATPSEPAKEPAKPSDTQASSGGCDKGVCAA